jgi:hypothetical protein
MKKEQNTIYIGYDPKEQVAYDVLRFTLDRTALEGIRVEPIRKDQLEHDEIYTRKHDVVDGQMIDCIDGKPFSSEFSFTRFLVPHLNHRKGWALYMDCDMYPRIDFNKLFEEYNNSFFPLYCVKHQHEPGDGIKMDGRVQQNYYRKNWSSFVLWNCEHPLNMKLTPSVVNSQTGQWLHAFGWLPDKEADIGSIHEEWNWLDGHSSEDIEAKNVHFTTGGPWFKEWNPKRTKDSEYAVEWNYDYTHLAGTGKIKSRVYDE